MSLDFHLWTVFLGLVDSTDIGGVPVRTDNNEIEYAAPKCLPFNTDDAGVILGDEYDRSDPEVQNAFNQILLGGEIHGNKISKEAFVVLTMNGDSDRFHSHGEAVCRCRWSEYGQRRFAVTSAVSHQEIALLRLGRHAR